MQKLSIKEKIKILAVFTFIITLYFFNKSSAISFGDFLGFYSTSELGFELSTNPMSHFLYINSLRLFSLALFWNSHLENCIFFSIIFSVLTLFLLFFTIIQLTRSVNAALFSVLIFGTSFTFWRQTEIIEVYTFFAFFTQCLLFLVLDNRNFNKNKFIFTWLLWSISLLVHIKAILFLPMLVLYTYHQKEILNLKNLIIIFSIVFSFFMFLILVHVYIDKGPITGIFYGNTQFLKKATTIDLFIYFKAFCKSLGYLLYNFHIFLLPILLGIIYVYKTNIRFFLILLSIILPVYGFSMVYDVPDNYVFFIPSYQCLVIFAGIYISTFENKITIQRLYFYLFLTILLSPTIYFITKKVSYEIPFLNEINYKKKYKGGLNYLLWPGMKNNNDLLKLSTEIYLTGIKPIGFEEFEWNYNQAIEYLKSKKEIE